MSFKTKYHVNPHTGQPSVCYASERPCPYSPEFHFDTWDEAQRAAQTYMEEKYKTLPQEVVPTVKLNDPFMYDDLNNLHPEELREELRTTSDEMLLLSVITRSSKLSDDWDNIKAVFHNKHLPRAFIEDVVKMPNEYTPEIQRLIAMSPSMTEEDLMTFMDNTVDSEALYLSHMNPNISEALCIKLLDGNFKNLRHPTLNGLTGNPNLPEDYLLQFNRFIREETINLLRSRQAG